MPALSIPMAQFLSPTLRHAMTQRKGSSRGANFQTVFQLWTTLTVQCGKSDVAAWDVRCCSMHLASAENPVLPVCIDTIVCG